MKLGTYYGGFGGFDIGAITAGASPLWSIEYDEHIAGVARRNLGDHVRTADVLTINPASLPAVDHFHASPPCPNFSIAKSNALGGTEQPEDVAHAEAIANAIRVQRPRIFTLENVVGYRRSVSIRVVLGELAAQGYFFDLTNVCASKLGVPQTRNRLFIRAIRDGLLPPLVIGPSGGCWLDAIGDLADGLEDTKFAEWQARKLPSPLCSALLTRNGSNNEVGYRKQGQPAFTVIATQSGENRAFVVSGQDSKKGVRFGGQPAFAVTASQKACHRALLPGGRTVKISTRCLARWQSFPDSYHLPAQAALAGRGIGNAVPPPVAQAISSGLYQSLN